MNSNLKHYADHIYSKLSKTFVGQIPQLRLLICKLWFGVWAFHRDIWYWIISNYKLETCINLSQTILQWFSAIWNKSGHR